MANQSKATSTLLLSLLTLGLGSGCYTGLGDGPDGGGNGAGANSGGGGNGDQPPRVPADASEDDTPFSVPKDEARLLPFPVRMQNLSSLTGQSLDHPMFLELWELRYQLGDHDFASGVAPDLRWSAEKMQYWVRGLKPVCASAAMQEAYPDLLTDPRPMMRQAWGHEPAADEVTALDDLEAGLAEEDRYLVTCLAVLTALDFVSV